MKYVPLQPTDIGKEIKDLLDWSETEIHKSMGIPKELMPTQPEKISHSDAAIRLQIQYYEHRIRTYSQNRILSILKGRIEQKINENNLQV